ncbi:terpene synthase family protein [Streptomyces mirabilis]
METVAWMDRLRTYGTLKQRETLAAMKIGWFSCLVAPDEASADTLTGLRARRRLFSDMSMWFFALDDALFDEPDVGGGGLDDIELTCLHLDRVLENPVTNSSDAWPVIATRDLRIRTQRLATPRQLEQWVSAMRSYLLGATLGSKRRVDTVTLNDYVTIRLEEGAVPLVTTTIPIVGGYELPHSSKQDSRVRALDDMANFLTMWDNDLFGYARETFRSRWYGYPPLPNAITILAADCGADVATGARMAVAVRDRVMSLFLRLSREVIQEADPLLERYVKALGYFVRGFLEWSLKITRRFAHGADAGDTIPGASFVLPTIGAECPTDFSAEPLDLPVIAWWWDQLSSLPDAAAPERRVSPGGGLSLGPPA